MPSRNAIKVYVAGATYHVYNRGVEKRDIFIDDRDRMVFVHYLKSYLLPLGHPAQSAHTRNTKFWLSRCDLSSRLELLAYCLMPNHFHLPLRQQDETAMTEFMKRLGNGYVSYFNEHQKRVGALFQGRYKAVLAQDHAHLQLLSRYIHRNPVEMLAVGNAASLSDYPWSSYPDYLGLRATGWLHPESILDSFARENSGTSEITYREYVEEESTEDPAILGNFCLDQDV
jgi:putative transposase